MRKVFKQQYTRTIPEGAERVTIKVKKRKKGETVLVEVPAVRFRGADGQKVTAPLTRKGDRCRVESEDYYGDVKLPDGTMDRQKLCTNKTEAEDMLTRRQAAADKARDLGVPLEQLASEKKAKGLDAWLDEYEQAVRTGSGRRTRRSKPRPEEEHVSRTLYRIRALVDGCGFTSPAEIELGKVQAWLEELQAPDEAPQLPEGQDAFRPGELAELLGISLQAVAGLASRHGLTLTGNGRARRMAREDAQRLISLSTRGVTERTASYYAREVRGFTSWLVRRGALARDPLAELPGATLLPSHRHDRRAMEEEEIGQLLDSTRASKRTFRGLAGEDRWALYLAALSTGFRASELASLTPRHFRLEDDLPVVLLGELASKNRQGADQPIPSQVVAPLLAYLKGREAGKPVWPGTWPDDGADMLRADLKEAGVAHILPGRDGELFLDFHALRHSFIARLERAGVPLKTASELARHSTVELTAKVYARPRLKDLAGAVNKLDAPKSATPPPATPVQQAAG